MFNTNCLQVLQQHDRAAVLWTSVLTRQAHMHGGLARALRSWFSTSTKGTLHNVSTLISEQRGSCVDWSRLVSRHLSILKFFTIPQLISAHAMLKAIVKYRIKLTAMFLAGSVHIAWQANSCHNQRE